MFQASPKLAVQEFRRHIDIWRTWLRKISRFDLALPGPKIFTKVKLRHQAMRRWNVSKNAFDYASSRPLTQ